MDGLSPDGRQAADVLFAVDEPVDPVPLDDAADEPFDEEAADPFDDPLDDPLDAAEDASSDDEAEDSDEPLPPEESLESLPRESVR